MGGAGIVLRASLGTPSPGFVTSPPNLTISLAAHPPQSLLAYVGLGLRQREGGVFSEQLLGAQCFFDILHGNPKRPLFSLLTEEKTEARRGKPLA